MCSGMQLVSTKPLSLLKLHLSQSVWPVGKPRAYMTLFHIKTAYPRKGTMFLRGRQINTADGLSHLFQQILYVQLNGSSARPI